MFALAVELLTGRYAATTFNDRDSAEWPPHPARMFSALVAAWADADEPNGDERAALRWLEDQAPPELVCDPVDEVWKRAVVTHFVPVNDVSALGRDVADTYNDLAEATANDAAADRATGREATRLRSAARKVRTRALATVARATTATGGESPQVTANVRAVLPWERLRQPRTFPTVRPTNPRFAFAWRSAEPDQRTFDALTRVASRVGRLGNASSFVSVATTHSLVSAPTYRADTLGTMPLRVARSGLLDALEEEFRAHGGTEPRSLPHAVARYGPASNRLLRPRPLLGGDWYVLPMPVRGPDAEVQRRPRVTRTLDVSRAVRGALLAHGRQPGPPFLTGHRAATDGGPGIADGPHLAVVPLPDVGSVHSGGAILGVALVLPTDCSDDDRAAVEEALATWGRDDRALMLGGVNASLLLRLSEPVLQSPGVRGPDVPLATLRRSSWCRPATTWVSVTPVALDRFPGDLRSRDGVAAQRAEDAAVQTIGRACELSGLPVPAEIALQTTSFLVGTPPAAGGPSGAHFPGYSAGGSGQRRATVHARVRFTDEVQGPVLIGAGRYLGYGLFRPVADPTGAGASGVGG